MAQLRSICTAANAEKWQLQQADGANVSETVTIPLGDNESKYQCSGYPENSQITTLINHSLREE